MDAVGDRPDLSRVTLHLPVKTSVTDKRGWGGERERERGS